MAEGLEVRLGRTPVLSGVSLTITPGQTVAMLGPNGSGKTTLLRSLAGLVPPAAGQIRYGRRAIGQLGAGYRHSLGYLPQGFDFYHHFTVRQTLSYLAAIRLVHPALVPGRVDQVMDAFGLTSKADTRLTALSLGERQRVGLAQALVHDPDVLLLDEPSSFLDPEERVALHTHLRVATPGRIIIFATHLPDEALAAADRVAILCKGRLCYDGPAMALSPDPDRAYLERLPKARLQSANHPAVHLV